MKLVMQNMREATVRGNAHVLYVPHETWFRMAWTPVVARAAQLRSSDKNAHITGGAADALASPIYNHFCVYAFLSEDSRLIGRRPRQLAPNGMLLCNLSRYRH